MSITDIILGFSLILGLVTISAIFLVIRGFLPNPLVPKREIPKKNPELEEARIELEKEKILRPIKEQAVDLELRREQPGLELEREKLHLQARVAVIEQIVQLFAQLKELEDSGLIEDSRSLDQLTKVLVDNVSNIWKDLNVTATDSVEYRSGTQPPKNAKEELIFQVMEASNLEGFIGENLLELPDGRWNLRILLGGNRLEFLYNLAGEKPIITDVSITNSQDFYYTIDPIPYRRLSLVQVLRKLLENYDPN